MHNGKYKCHASNGHKQSIYEEFTVRVPSAPIVTVHTSTVRAPRNHTFHIGCMASSHPQITSLGSVSWFKGSRRIQNNRDDYRYSISDSNDGLTSISILNTPRVNSTVAGTYRCEFSNNQGSASQTIRLDGLFYHAPHRLTGNHDRRLELLLSQEKTDVALATVF
ncbi:putative titin [Apostichopus japonicus]|uniref:Putative titin n=1 Tax=Stichopus japonicus TaxID=307972 RepID=A0A2G8K1V7_STIJA|nr:putative titin [Apostichopus japonicus]